MNKKEFGWLFEILVDVQDKFSVLPLGEVDRFADLFAREGNFEYAALLARHAARRGAAGIAPHLGPRRQLTDFQKNARLRDLRERRQLVVAIQLAHTLLSEAPDNKAVINLLGTMLTDAMEHETARRLFEKLAELMPNNPIVLANLGRVLRHLKRPVEAIAWLEKSLAVGPGNSTTWQHLSAALSDCGDMAGARRAVAKAASFDPKNSVIVSLQIFLAYDDPDVSAAEHRAVAEHYRTLIGSQQPLLRPPFIGDGSGALRVGFVSGDLRSHAVSHFLASFHAELPANGIEPFFYSTSFRTDSVSTVFQAEPSRYRDIWSATDEAAAALIRKDRIDVLIDLSGHTAFNRLPMFTLRPAPVQATYLGFFGTTGLPEIDFLVGDDICTPPEFASHFVERIARIDGGYLCFKEPEKLPKLGTEACLRNGHITYGCLNRVGKFNAEMDRAWMRVLAATPGSKFVLAGDPLSLKVPLERMHAIAREHGVDPGRIGFLPRVARNEYLAHHNEIDVILDTHPYGGVTTTAEALTMGVPVINLRGDQMLSRMPGAVLLRAGEPGWVTDSVDEYVEAAVSTARRIEQGELTKKFVRDRARRSVLFDGAGFARRFADCIRWMDATIRSEVQAGAGS